MPVVISKLRRLNNPIIRALFSLELPSGAVLNSCTLVYSKDRRCLTVKPPQIPMMTSTGEIARDPDGTVHFEAAIAFRAATARRHFEHTALAALRQVAPDLFAQPRDRK